MESLMIIIPAREPITINKMSQLSANLCYIEKTPDQFFKRHCIRATTRGSILTFNNERKVESERATSTTNKDVRNIREFMARTIGHTENLTDIFNYLFLHSDSLIHYMADRTSSTQKSPCLNEQDAVLETII
jgi:hypothetical protein